MSPALLDPLREDLVGALGELDPVVGSESRRVEKTEGPDGADAIEEPPPGALEIEPEPGHQSKSGYCYSSVRRHRVIYSLVRSDFLARCFRDVECSLSSSARLSSSGNGLTAPSTESVKAMIDRALRRVSPSFRTRYPSPT